MSFLVTYSIVKEESNLEAQPLTPDDEDDEEMSVSSTLTVLVSNKVSTLL
jgi:hypothetical protein